MFESNIRLMPSWVKRLLGVSYEEFPTHINTLQIKLDQLPNPTKEECKVSKISVTGRRYLTIHWPGKIILRILCKNNHSGPSALTQDGQCLEIYPIPH